MTRRRRHARRLTRRRAAHELDSRERDAARGGARGPRAAAAAPRKGAEHGARPFRRDPSPHCHPMRRLRRRKGDRIVGGCRRSELKRGRERHGHKARCVAADVDCRGCGCAQRHVGACCTLPARIQLHEKGVAAWRAARRPQRQRERVEPVDARAAARVVFEEAEGHGAPGGRREGVVGVAGAGRGEQPGRSVKDSTHGVARRRGRRGLRRGARGRWELRGRA